MTTGLGALGSTSSQAQGVAQPSVTERHQENVSLLKILFSCLPLREVHTCLQVSKSWQKAASNEALWRRLFIEAFPETAPSVLEKHQIHPKRLFEAHLNRSKGRDALVCPPRCNFIAKPDCEKRFLLDHNEKEAIFVNSMGEVYSWNIEERQFKLKTFLNIETQCGSAQSYDVATDLPEPLLSVKTTLDQIIPMQGNRFIALCSKTWKEENPNPHRPCWLERCRGEPEYIYHKENVIKVFDNNFSIIKKISLDSEVIKVTTRNSQILVLAKDSENSRSTDELFGISSNQRTKCVRLLIYDKDESSASNPCYVNAIIPPDMSLHAILCFNADGFLFLETGYNEDSGYSHKCHLVKIDEGINILKTVEIRTGRLKRQAFVSPFHQEFFEKSVLIGLSAEHCKIYDENLNQITEIFLGEDVLYRIKNISFTPQGTLLLTDDDSIKVFLDPKKNWAVIPFSDAEAFEPGNFRNIPSNCWYWYFYGYTGEVNNGAASKCDTEIELKNGASFNPFTGNMIYYNAPLEIVFFQKFMNGLCPFYSLFSNSAVAVSEEVLESFRELPETVRNKVYEELFLIKFSSRKDLYWGMGEEAFLDIGKQKGSTTNDERYQAVSNYLIKAKIELYLTQVLDV